MQSLQSLIVILSLFSSALAAPTPVLVDRASGQALKGAAVSLFTPYNIPVTWGKTDFKVHLGIGSGQSGTFTLEVDTGSGDLWIPSSLNNGNQNFVPSKSSTYKAIPNEYFIDQYGDNTASITSGSVFYDKISVGEQSLFGSTSPQVIGLASTVSDVSLDGILGLAVGGKQKNSDGSWCNNWSNKVYKGTLGDKINQVNSVPANTLWMNYGNGLTFATYFNLAGSPVLQLDVDPVTGDTCRYTGSITWATSTNACFYYVPTVSVSATIGSSPYTISSSYTTALIDSGSTATKLQKNIVDAFYNSIPNVKLQYDGSADQLIQIACNTDLSTLPTLKVPFGKGYATLDNKLFLKGWNQGQPNQNWCYGALQYIPSTETTNTYGTWFYMSNYVIHQASAQVKPFDNINQDPYYSRIGIATMK